MVVAPESPWADPQLRRARIVTFVSLVTSAWTSVIMPGIGLWHEPSAQWVVLGAVGILAFAAAQAGALYAVVTPWLTGTARRRLLGGFTVAAVLSVPMAGPVASGRWATWAWLGASVVGTAPLLMGRWWAAVATATAVAVAVGVASWTDGSVRDHAVIAGGVGLGVALVNRLQVWFWNLLVLAQQARTALARLAATEERLRFARDVHDLLGHSLTVISLKAELAARLAPLDAQRAGQEAGEVQRMAASALTEMRQVVHGYRAVNLREQVAAIERVLRSCGVRCTVTQATGDVPPEIATQLATVLREAGTNILRHSRAGWCTIEIARQGTEVRLTVTNDGAAGDGRPDRHSVGLRGLAERLAEAGGNLRTRHEGGLFTVEATLQATP